MLGSYRKDDYRAFRVWAESLDGTQVPPVWNPPTPAWLTSPFPLVLLL